MKLELRLARGKGGIYLSPEVSDYSRTVVKRVAASGQEEVILEDESSGRTPMETGIIRTGTRGIVAVPLQKLQMADAAGETFVGKVAGDARLALSGHPLAGRRRHRA